MGITVRELVAKLSLVKDQASFTAGGDALDRIKTIALGVGTAVAAAFAVSKIAGFVDETRELGAHLDDVNRATGVSTQTLQEFGYAAKLGGASVEGANAALERLGRLQGDAIAGGTESAKVFDALGIKIKDAAGKALPLDQILLQVSDKMKAAKSDAERLNMSFDFFGRGGGAAMVGVLKDGSKALRESMQEARTLGIVLDEGTIKATADLDDNMDRLDYSAQGLKTTIGAALVPSVLKLTNAMLEWWKANGAIIRQDLKATFDAVGKALDKAGSAARILSEHWVSLAVVALLAATAVGVYQGVAVLAALSSWTLGSALMAVASGFVAAGAGAWAFLSPLIPIVAVAAAAALTFLILDDAITGIMGGESLITANSGKWGAFAKALDDETTKANASWWQVVLGKIGVGLLEILEGADNLGNAFADFIANDTFGDFIARQVDTALAAITRLVRTGTELLSGFTGRFGLSLPGAGEDSGSPVAGFFSALANPSGQSPFGPVGQIADATNGGQFSIDPYMQASAPVGPYRADPPSVTNTFEITVDNSGSGWDPDTLAQALGKTVAAHVGDAMDQHWLEAQQTLVPGG